MVSDDHARLAACMIVKCARVMVEQTHRPGPIVHQPKASRHDPLEDPGSPLRLPRWKQAPKKKRRITERTEDEVDRQREDDSYAAKYRVHEREASI